MVAAIAVNVWSVGNNQTAQAHGEEESADKQTGGEGETTADSKCAEETIPENATRTKCVVVGNEGTHWNVWGKQTCVPASHGVHCTTDENDTRKTWCDDIHYRVDADSFTRGCPHQDKRDITDGYVFLRHYNTHGQDVHYQHYECNAGYTFVAFGDPPCQKEGDTEDTGTGTSDDTTTTTTTTTTTAVPVCIWVRVNPATTKQVCPPTTPTTIPPTTTAVPVCVWNHDHGRGCHPYTTPPCSYASESGRGRHWHGWHHSSCHNQEPPCPSGQHRHGAGRKATYQRHSHPHYVDRCHAVSPVCRPREHRHGDGQRATYLGSYTHRAGTISHWSDACHAVLPAGLLADGDRLGAQVARDAAIDERRFGQLGSSSSYWSW